MHSSTKSLKKGLGAIATAAALALPLVAFGDAVPGSLIPSDSSLQQGQTITVTGQCGIDNANTTGTLFLFDDATLQGHPLNVATGSLSATGEFSSAVTVPASTPNGSFDLVLFCDQDDTSVTTPVTVGTVTPVSTPTPTPAPTVAPQATPVPSASVGGAGVGSAATAVPAVGGGDAQISQVPRGGVVAGGGFLSRK